ncbi:LPS export ABC transporter permease LptF [Hahella sp. KA22]|uniref:LPS export ABC transporter permease LptF n=1 Tax=Hahella sp. KA22 TaxID=1628392 RepID=UPI000FDD99FC|nr:LPS export ABC transporter permease LptF [Hahella sp. KA22]AZZ92557.1 LPS export ABC transporter permease LptF [Hahella sp. KA22]QAY55930.1 LPS export ABC transporter permease LptF [Hahella sp. KA22]
MWVLFRYLNRQILTSLFGLTFLLLFVFTSTRFAQYLTEAATGQISADVLAPIMAYRLPGFLQLILPLALFLSILLSYGRMYLDAEMTAIFASGVSKSRLVAVTMGSGFAIALVVGSMSLYLNPLGRQQTERILLEQAKRSRFELVTPGRFQRFSEGEDGRVSYVESLSNDDREMRNVFMAETDKEKGQTAVLTGESGHLFYDAATGNRFLVIDNGARYVGTPGQADYRSVTFDTYGIRLDEPDLEREAFDETIPTATLWRSDSPKASALLQWRLSLPMLAPIVALLAVSLSRVNPRQGRFHRLLTALLVYVSYLGLLIYCKKAVAKQSLPDWLGLWSVHVAYFCFGLLLLYGQEIRLRLQPRSSTPSV